MSGGQGNLNANIPAPIAPLVDETRNVTPVWRAYFLVLQRRTGGSTGVSTADHARQIQTEQAIRIAADDALQQGLDAEIAARIAGDNAEAASRGAADDSLATRVASLTEGLTNEILRAQDAEALLVPLDQLCSLWSQCNFGFLPTSDPGGGLPWLNGNTMMVGTPAIVTTGGIGLEDDSGVWLLEDGSGRWLWG